MIRVSGIRVPVDGGDEAAVAMAAGRLGIPGDRVRSWRIVRRSIDARRRGPTAFVLSMDLEVREEAVLLARLSGDPEVEATPQARYLPPRPGRSPLPSRPVIVGTGPAGLFAGLLLARMGYRPLLLERGDPVEARVAAVTRFFGKGPLDPDSNVQFGEGGAGTFSDGKLTTRIRDPRCAFVTQELVRAGAPPEVAWSWRPHVGTDLLRGVIRSLRDLLLGLGAEVLFRARLHDLRVQDGRLDALELADGTVLPAQAAVLAIGHSARDTFEMLHRHRLEMTPKPYAVGVRIEHLQADIDRVQYRELAGHPSLGPASYQLAWQSPEGRGAYTFCMCPGGLVVAACSEAGRLVTNGMSLHARDGTNSNSALVVTVGPDDFGGTSPLSGVEFQREWERRAFDAGGGGHVAPAQAVGDFLARRSSSRFGRVLPTFPRGVVPASLDACLPPSVAWTLRAALPALDARMRGFADADAVLTAIETRTSSPVRMVRDEACESSIRGLFPAGEGAGYAGGIVSAAVDGLRVAESIVSRYAPLEPGVARED